jgi:membrane-associated protease RseP (regulator of RpoE activity)
MSHESTQSASSDSAPSAPHDELDGPQQGEGSPASAHAPKRLQPLLLFIATVLSMFFAGAMYNWPAGLEQNATNIATNLYRGWTFAVPLLAILLFHEFGHYFAAKYHRVPASLPHFIPLPISPFGTMGALISMPERIRSRNALLDIGAAGPLAGLVVAIPVVVIGLMHSPVQVDPGGSMVEGQSLLYMGLKRLVLGPIPAGHDVFLNATAFAGWAGLLVTALNLIPIGQLDGGHIAYALFGKRQDIIATVLHALLPVAFLYNYAVFGNANPGTVWLVWFVLLGAMRRASGCNHPPTQDGPLSPGRRWVAIFCLVMFALLFMPTPMRLGAPVRLQAWLVPALQF